MIQHWWNLINDWNFKWKHQKIISFTYEVQHEIILSLSIHFHIYPNREYSKRCNYTQKYSNIFELKYSYCAAIFFFVYKYREDSPEKNETYVFF